MKKKKIALFGFGCVGQGLYDIIQQQNDLPFEISKICVKDPNKTRNLPGSVFTYDKHEIFNDNEIEIIAEAISDDDEALEIVKLALKHGKKVVSASKKMLADNLADLIELESKSSGVLIYEASVCGSIPVLRTLQDYYRRSSIDGISGILNGSSNYILSKIIDEDCSYTTALREAQELGFAETDPTLDVGGFDASNKLCIIARHGFHMPLKTKEIFQFGIRHISEHEIAFAQKKGYKIKQVAILQKTKRNRYLAMVIPAFVDGHHPLYKIDNEYNGVILQSEFMGDQLLTGKGAGSHPTGWAMFSDLLAITNGYRYNYYNNDPAGSLPDTDFAFNIYLKCTSDMVMIALDFKLLEDLSPGTAYRFVYGSVKLKDLLKFRSSENFNTTFITLDLRYLLNKLSSINEKKDIVNAMV